MKNILKRALTIFLVVTVVLFSSSLSSLMGIDLPDYLDFSIESSAATTGTCGDNLTWTLDDSTGTLTISGSGKMWEYGTSDGTDGYSVKVRPWETYKIQKVIICEGVTDIGNGAFYGCYNLRTVEMTDSVTTIGHIAFGSCDSLSDIKMSENITSIGDYAFDSCSNLASISIPTQVEIIGVDAFCCCTSLTSITIPDNVISIGDEIFCYCSSLKSITIPKNVKSIGDYVFLGCSSLMDVYYIGTKEEWEQIDIGTGNESFLNATIHYHYDNVCDFSVFLRYEKIHPHYAVFKCSKCDEVKTDTSKTGYRKVIDNAVTPTCTETGLTEGEHCSVCNEILVEQTVIDELGHSYGEWVVETPAQPGVAGIEKKTCKNCSAFEEREIPAEKLEITIQQPSQKNIRCKDGIVLHANVNGTLPEGATIEWTANNSNFKYDQSASGKETTIVSNNNGYTTFTVTLYDANGEKLASDTVEMYSKASFFDKIGGFFRSLFGSTVIYER